MAGKKATGGSGDADGAKLGFISGVLFKAKKVSAGEEWHNMVVQAHNEWCVSCVSNPCQYL